MNPKNLAATFINESATATLSPTIAPYEIFLYPDYKRLKVYAETDITATLNFDTASVIINAYLDSVKNGDTVEIEVISPAY